MNSETYLEQAYSTTDSVQVREVYVYKAYSGNGEETIVVFDSAREAAECMRFAQEMFNTKLQYHSKSFMVSRAPR